MDLSYESIEKHIVLTEIEGTKMYCEFQTIDGEIVSSTVPIRHSKSIQGQVTKRVTRVASNKVRRSASRLLRTALGGGMLGRIGSSVVRTSTKDLGKSLSFTTEDKQNAVVEAFKKVSQHFNIPTQTQTKVNDRSNRRSIRVKKVNVKNLSSFDQQIKKYPVTNNYDREILARILTELANADGTITQEEKDFLDSFLSPPLNNINELLLKDPISSIECEEVSEKVKPTIYLLAWAVSLIDYDLDPNEQSILFEYADMFGFSEEQTDKLILDAKYYVLEQSFTFETRRSDILDLAQGLSLSNDEAERCLIHWKKRN